MRVRIEIAGIVQGVGFRPFVARIAAREHLAGWVRNAGGRVIIEAEGPEGAIASLHRALEAEAPEPASLKSIHVRETQTRGDAAFRIAESDAANGGLAPWLLPDLATCDACMAEALDPVNRRGGYPFLSCTGCGPRYSVLEALPWDRERTTLAGFPLCPACRAEYDSPEDRRYHAETTACSACGPKAWFESEGSRIDGEAAIGAAARMVREGGILGLLGLGGYVLVCDAADEGAVAALRIRKRREARPFAVMFPPSEVDPTAWVRRWAVLDGTPEIALTDARRPIVILPIRPEAPAAHGVAMGLPWIGAMLPTTALHALMMRQIGKPVVCTSGNASGDPILHRLAEDRELIRSMADGVLLHDRPILRGIDDSVVRFAGNREILLRRARGVAPASLPSPFPLPSILAAGGQLKSAVAVGAGHAVALGPHIGDLETPRSIDAFERQAQELPRLLGVSPVVIACDAHSGYRSSLWARRQDLPVIEVQHHHAHVAAVMGESGLARDDEVLGLAWDGTGRGPDGRAWGGEALRCRYDRYERVASFLPFPLLGGAAAVRDPRRVALALLLEARGASALETAPCIGGRFSEAEREALVRLWQRRADVESTSVGRLFDAMAEVILDGAPQRYEGEAAMRLEAACGRDAVPFPPAPLRPNPDRRPHEPCYWIDWRPWFDFVLDAVERSDPASLAMGFHRALAETAAALHRLPEAGGGELPLALGGGCFQNALLVRSILALVPEALTASQAPPGDGGLGYGQVLVAGALTEEG